MSDGLGSGTEHGSSGDGTQRGQSEKGTVHVDQSLPTEWLYYDLGGREMIIRDVPEGTVQCYVVSATTRNVRSLANADAVIYDGTVVNPHYDEDIRCVEFCHDFGGVIDRRSVTEWLDQPAVRLTWVEASNAEEIVNV